MDKDKIDALQKTNDLLATVKSEMAKPPEQRNTALVLWILFKLMD